MSFVKNMHLDKITPTWAARCVRFSTVADVPILPPPLQLHMMLKVTTLIFLLSPNHYSTQEVKIVKSVNKSGEEVTENGYKKECQVS